MLGESMCCRIRYWRDQRGLTQEQLATRLGIVQGTLSRYENGKTAIRHPMLWRIAHELEVSVDDLMRQKEKLDNAL